MAKHHKPLSERLPILGEFKKFVLRGNVIDLAVGVIIGGAFNKIVTSLVNDIVMPFFYMIISTKEIDHAFIALDGNKYASIEEAGSAPIIKYGSFLSTVLDFLFMALVIFLMVKGLNTLQDKIKRTPAPAAPTTKKCKFCMMDIPIEAKRCAHCTADLRRSARSAVK